MQAGTDQPEKQAVLVMSDGTTYHGEGFGATGIVTGELVFTTNMAGYQEALTDPSYAGQILTFAFPLQGNYGINPTWAESPRVHVRGVVVREICADASHRKNQLTLSQFLALHGIPGIAGVDTRAIVRRVRTEGVMPACLAVYEAGAAPMIEYLLEQARHLNYGSIDFVQQVQRSLQPSITNTPRPDSKAVGRVGLMDYGFKESILRALQRRGLEVTVIPGNTPAADIQAMDLDGLILSNGPGDPELLDYATGNLRTILNETQMPVFGICLGHQLMGLAAGARTYKMKFGHRGINQPVQHLPSGRVYLTSQNHGYALDPETLPQDYIVSYRNLNDGTVEGIEHRSKPILAVQFHPEANAGPYDCDHIFDRFAAEVSRHREQRRAANALGGALTESGLK